MRISCILILCLSVLSIQESNGQSSKNPVSYRFENGEEGYIEFFAGNIQYPLNSRDSSYYGICIAKITISPKGEIIESVIINPINQEIDQEVLRIINLSRGKWRQIDTINYNQALYIQVAFTFFGIKPFFCTSSLPEFNALFAVPIVVTTGNSSKPRRPFTDDSTLLRSFERQISEGNALKALDIINELIRRDPFNKQFYQARSELFTFLNMQQRARADSIKISNFAEGISLDMLMENY